MNIFLPVRFQSRNPSIPLSMIGKAACSRNSMTSALQLGNTVCGVGILCSLAKKYILFLSARAWTSDGDCLGIKKWFCSRSELSATKMAVWSLVGIRIGRPPARRATRCRNVSVSAVLRLEMSHRNRPLQYLEKKEGEEAWESMLYTRTPARPRLLTKPSGPWRPPEIKATTGLDVSWMFIVAQ